LSAGCPPVKPISTAARERAVETELSRQVQLAGGLCEKVMLAGRRGFPDRLCLLPGSIMVLVETKRPRGGRLSVHQRQYRDRLALLGVVVEVVRNSEDIARLIDRIKLPESQKKQGPRR
jgi:hypothetical protein